MNCCQLTCGRQLATLLILLFTVSCDGLSLPDVPALEDLGFSDALGDVQRQVQIAYEQWQEQPRDAERNGHLGMLLSAYGKNAASAVLYRRAHLLAPGDFRWTYYLAVAHQQLGRYDDAVGLFREALSIDPEFVDAQIQLAGLLLQLNETEESIALFEEMTIEHPSRIEGWLGLGKALGRKGDLAAAANALQRARLIGPQYGEVHYALAAVLAASGDEEKAASEFAAYERTANNKIHTTDPLTLKIIALNASDGPDMARADRYMAQGQYEAAVASFRAALRINPVNQDAWGGLIDTLARMDKMDETGNSYRAALAAGVSYRRLHLTYGRALMRWQQPDAAREVIGAALELDPKYGNALQTMGELEMQRGAGESAVDHFRRAIAVLPNDRTIMLSLAQALNANKQFEEAAKWLEPLTSDSSLNQSLVLKELAIAYHGLGRKSDAIKTLQLSRDAALNKTDKSLLEAIDTLLADWQTTTR